MDSFQKIKKITFQMKAKQQAKIHEARAAKKDIQSIAELYSTLIGIKMVYNQILLIEKNSIIVSDETPDEIWEGEQQELF